MKEKVTSTTTSEGYQVYVGADIGLHSVSIAVLSPNLTKLEYIEIAQDAKEYSRLHKMLSAHAKPKQTLIVMESTGTYWMPLALYLQQANYPVSVANPLTAKHFFRADLSRDKNDKLDSFNLAELGAFLHTKLPLWTPPPPIYEELRQRLDQRDTLKRIKVMQEQQTHAVWGRPVLISSVNERRETLVTHLNAEIRALDKELKAVLLDDPDWGQSARRLLSIPGIGLVSAAWLLVATLNFTTCDTPEQVASFAGLVPRQKQSGASDAPRHIGHAGHARLRQVLYLSTVTALRFNPVIKRYYEKLIGRGKPGKVAVIACERKLLHLAWACVVKERMFEENKLTTQTQNTSKI